MERIEHVARLETKYLEVADAALTEAEKAFINAHPIYDGTNYCFGYEVSLWEYTYGDDDDDEVDDDELTHTELDYSRYFVQVGVQKSKKGVWKEIDEKDITNVDCNDPKFEDDFEDYEDAEKYMEEHIRYINQQGSKFA